MTPIVGLEAGRIERFLATVTDVDRDGTVPSLPDVAAEWDRCAVEPGSAVLVALPNGLSMLTVFFALLGAGAIPVPVAPAAGPDRIAAIARSLGASALVAKRTPAALLDGSRKHRLADAECLVWTTAAAIRYPERHVILLTSGTSGITTGCLHDFTALLRNARRHAASVGQRADDTVLLNLPLYYSYALVAQVLASVVSGSRLVVSGPPFTPPAYRHSLTEHGVTVSSLTPSAVEQLSEAGFRPPATLRALTVGGDVLRPVHLPMLLAATPEVYVTYGLTEAGPRVSTLAAHREPARRFASVGLPLQGTEVSLRPSPVGSGAGELLVRSDTVLRRKVPEGTADPLVAADTIATGDSFDVDDDGYLFFRGRLSDSVVINGEKVWLPSVRQVISSMRGVRAARTVVAVTETGGRCYDLEVYADDRSGVDVADVRRTLRRLLLRPEQPRNITLRPATEGVWHK
ncbi:class I adenylate-forming enzyme family protein [Micromonospora sp. NPDC050276]|uniref:class I adenylate-forming enzyme family protein n=1 Tax=Micromonospora sp. NPDC050276 TaxID=3364278 RepID=UPI0037BCEF36